jgi:glycosyltransferase involved in cell wall biosynthesis
MRKILFISLYPLNELGGGERFTLESFQSVQHSGDLCAGYALHRGFPDDSPLTKRLCMPFRHFEGRGLIGQPPVSFRQLLIEAASYDVIWVHQYLSNVMIYDILGNTASDQLVILTGEGHEPEREQFGACFQPCPNVSIVEISDCAVALSRRFGTRLWSVGAGIWKKDILGTDASVKRRGQICSTGRILPHKGIEITIEGSPAGSSLKIIGSRILDAAYTQYLSAVPARADVEFMGQVSDRVKQKVMRESEVFVASSTETLYNGRAIPQAELLGLVIMEALASGTLPVVSDVPSFVEVMQNLGLKQFVYPQRSVRGLEEILRDVLSLDSTTRCEIVKAAQKKLERLYLWDDYWPRVKRICGMDSTALAARS